MDDATRDYSSDQARDETQSPQHGPDGSTVREIVEHVRENPDVLAQDGGQKGVRIVEMVAQQRSFYGPLPPPDVCREYEDIQAGSLDRLISLMERQSTHRQQLESQSLEAEIRDENNDHIERLRGQIFALVIGVVGLISGCAIVITGLLANQPIGGGLLGGLFGTGGVGALVWAFLAARDDQVIELPIEEAGHAENMAPPADDSDLSSYQDQKAGAPHGYPPC